MFRGSTASRGRRLATLLAAAGTAVVIGFAGQPAQAASTTADPAAAAAGWLAEQLVDGERIEVEFDGETAIFPSLTLDALLAFAAAGVAGDHADAAFAWLATPETLELQLGEPGSRSADGYAKLAFTVNVYGRDASSFGGVDLLADLRELEDDNGRFTDDSETDDLSNGTSQAFAILTLAGTPEGVPDAAVDFLLGERCDDGGYPFNFAQESCASEIDTTAVAAQALLAAGREQEARSALEWLAGQQQPGGGFEDSPVDPLQPVNANSTGLAAQALRAGGMDDAADDAVAFLRSLQVGCDGPDSEQGAVRHTESDPGELSLATAQAVLGLAGVGMAELADPPAGAEAPRLDCGSQSSPVPDGDGASGGTAAGQSSITGPVLAGAGVLLLGAAGVTVWVIRRRRNPTAPTAPTS